MKININSIFAKKVHEAVKNDKFMWTSNSFYILFTLDKYVMFRVESTIDLLRYFSEIKPLEADYDSFNKIFERSSFNAEVIVEDLTYSDFTNYKSGMIRYQVGDESYCFNPKLFTNLTKGYIYKLWKFDHIHGVDIYENVSPFPHDEDFEKCAVLLGVRI